MTPTQHEEPNKKGPAVNPARDCRKPEEFTPNYMVEIVHDAFYFGSQHPEDALIRRLYLLFYNERKEDPFVKLSEYYQKYIELLEILGLRRTNSGPDDYQGVRGYNVEMLANNPEYLDRLLALVEQSKIDKNIIQLFLALEFGDDFGDSLLNIAENVQKEQLEKIFGIIHKYRELSRKYASWYEARDPKFANDTALAINERLTDILALLERVALNGKTTIDTAPHRNKEGYESDGKFEITFISIDEIIESMEELEKSLQLITDIVPHADTVVTKSLKNDDKRGFEIYRFHNEELGDVLLYVRPEGAGHYDPALEYGNYDGVEASISWMVNPNDPHHIAVDKDIDAVSFRFDREGRLVSEDPFTDERSPIREKGLISQDISSAMGPRWATPVKLGRMVAAGNIIRSNRLGVESELHHNADHFDQEKYGTSTGFASLAHYIMSMAEARVRESRASKRRTLGSVAGRVSSKSAA